MAGRYDKQGCCTGLPGWESIPGLLKRFTNTGFGQWPPVTRYRGQSVLQPNPAPSQRVRSPKVYLGSCVQLHSLDEAPQLPPSPCIWAHIRGRYIGQPRQTTSLCNPLPRNWVAVQLRAVMQTERKPIGHLFISIPILLKFSSNFYCFVCKLFCF